MCCVPQIFMDGCLCQVGDPSSAGQVSPHSVTPGSVTPIPPFLGPTTLQRFGLEWGGNDWVNGSTNLLGHECFGTRIIPPEIIMRKTNMNMGKCCASKSCCVRIRIFFLLRKIWSLRVSTSKVLNDFKIYTELIGH